MMSKESVADLFPNKNPDAITGKPTYDSLIRLFAECTKNLAAIPSTLGGGAHGLSGLLLTHAKYLRDTTIAWVDPIFPGQVPNMTGATNAPARDAYTAQHSADMKQYNNAVVASASIRKIVSECIEDTYLQALKNPSQVFVPSPSATSSFLFSNSMEKSLRLESLRRLKRHKLLGTLLRLSKF